MFHVAYALGSLQSQDNHAQRQHISPEVDILIGNPAKAKEKLGWVPTILFKFIPTIKNLNPILFYPHKILISFTIYHLQKWIKFLKILKFLVRIDPENYAL